MEYGLVGGAELWFVMPAGVDVVSMCTAQSHRPSSSEPIQACSPLRGSYLYSVPGFDMSIVEDIFFQPSLSVQSAGVELLF
jgi:hypothetical protein